MLLVNCLKSRVYFRAKLLKDTRLSRTYMCDIEDLDKKYGFSRCGQDESCVGTVDSYDQHLFVRTVSDQWPGEVHKAHGPIVQLLEIIKKFKKENTKNFRVTLCSEELSQSSDVTAKSSKLEEEQSFDVLVFPSKLQYNNVTVDNIENVLRHDHSKDPQLINGISTTSLEGSNFVFVCAHKAKDERCGFCGPRLIAAAVEIERQVGDTKTRIFKVSHIGGHKYAGNVILFPSGDWYGYVTPTNISTILELQRKGNLEQMVVPKLWRGRMGLNKAQQKELGKS